MIEDQADLREALVMVLQMAGYDTAEAADGAEAVALLDGGGHPDVIILDLCMPHMDGAAFRAWQRSRLEVADIPVVVFSAAPKRDLEGVYAWLRKGNDVTELLAVVDGACTRPVRTH